jgi:predicted transcriptional regulator of viral defense system
MPQPAPRLIRKMPSIFRSRDFAAAGNSLNDLSALLAQGAVEKLGRGLYRRGDAPVTEYETLAAVAARIPGGIVCLLSALRFHEIGTQSPREVWIAIDRKAWRPVLDEYAVRIIRFSGPMLRHGIERREAGGVALRITSPARTVVDCFRYRNKIGMEIALEALREALRERKTTPDAILRVAEACRARKVIQPYLEAMAS